MGVLPQLCSMECRLAAVSGMSLVGGKELARRGGGGEWEFTVIVHGSHVTKAGFFMMSRPLLFTNGSAMLATQQTNKQTTPTRVGCSASRLIFHTKILFCFD